MTPPHSPGLGTRRLRIAILGMLLAVAIGFARAPVARAETPAASKADATFEAVVVVDTGSIVYTRLIVFGTTSITGLEALELAGAAPETIGYSAQGTAVCKLFGIGNLAAPSQCLGSGSDPRYWAYYRSPSGSGAYRYSPVGAGATRVTNGGVEAWRFGTGSAPAQVSFCQVVGCQAQQVGAPETSPAPSNGSSGSGSSTTQGAPSGGGSSAAQSGPTSGEAAQPGQPGQEASGPGAPAPADSSGGGESPESASGNPDDAVSSSAVSGGPGGGGAPKGQDGNGHPGTDGSAAPPGNSRSPAALAVFFAGLTGLAVTGIYYRRLRRGSLR